MLHIHGLANTNIKVFTWKPHLFVAQSGKYHECQSWSDEGSCRWVCVTKKWLSLEDKSLDTDQLSSTIHVTESQIILAKKELWRWSFTSWSVWRGFGWSFQSHPDHRQGWQGRWGEGCQQEEPTSWDTRYIKIRFHLKLNDRLADNMVWENWVLDLAEKVFAPKSKCHGPMVDHLDLKVRLVFASQYVCPCATFARLWASASKDGVRALCRLSWGALPPSMQLWGALPLSFEAELRHF